MKFPTAVQREMGYALFLAQMGEHHPGKTKMLKGFGGGTVVEVKESTIRMLIVPSTLCDMPTLSMCSTRFRRSRRQASRRRNWT